MANAKEAVAAGGGLAGAWAGAQLGAAASLPVCGPAAGVCAPVFAGAGAIAGSLGGERTPAAAAKAARETKEVYERKARDALRLSASITGAGSTIISTIEGADRRTEPIAAPCVAKLATPTARSAGFGR